ncbi:hypothetical protein CBL_20231 [Carabus blaptoides fortunei]
MFAVLDPIIELPEQRRVDTSTFQTVQFILMHYPCRIVYLIKVHPYPLDKWEFQVSTWKRIMWPYFNDLYATFSYHHTVDQCSLYFWFFVAKVENILAVLTKVRELCLIPSRHNLVFVSQLNETVDINQVERIFRTCFAKEIFNVVLMVKKEEMYTYFPCSNELAVRINGSLFPDKFKDMNGHLK